MNLELGAFIDKTGIAALHATTVVHSSAILALYRLLFAKGPITRREATDAILGHREIIQIALDKDLYSRDPTDELDTAFPENVIQITNELFEQFLLEIGTQDD